MHVTGENCFGAIVSESLGEGRELNNPLGLNVSLWIVRYVQVKNCVLRYVHIARKRTRKKKFHSPISQWNLIQLHLRSWEWASLVPSPPPPDQNFFITARGFPQEDFLVFIQFSKKNNQIVGWYAPPTFRGWRPTAANPGSATVLVLPDSKCHFNFNCVLWKRGFFRVCFLSVWTYPVALTCAKWLLCLGHPNLLLFT